MSNLGNYNSKEYEPVRLSNKSKNFKIALEEKMLENNYSFKGLNKNNGHKEFDRFINKILGNTITDVEKNWKRASTVKENENINNKKREILHLGEDGKKLRLFGYYNDDYYFVITRIDPNHEVHKV